jgi:hypothetical protein
MSASAVGISCAQRGYVSPVFRHPNGVEDGLHDVVVLLGGRSRWQYSRSCQPTTSSRSAM